MPSGVSELGSAGDLAMRKESFDRDCKPPGVAVVQYKLLSEWIRDWEKLAESTVVGLHCGW